MQKICKNGLFWLLRYGSKSFEHDCETCDLFDPRRTMSIISLRLLNFMKKWSGRRENNANLYPRRRAELEK